MAWPEKKFFFGARVQKMPKLLFTFLGTICCGLCNESKKKGGAHTSLEIWALQKFGPRGLETLFCRFLRFFFSAQGCTHTHHRPRIGAKPTSTMIFWGLGTTWPHQPAKMQGGLPPGQRQRAAPLGTGLRRLPKGAPLRLH